jgi:hypothetical protein
VLVGNIDDPDPEFRPADGQSAFAAPFAPYGTVIFQGNTLIVHDQEVIFDFDPTQANATLHVLAGFEPHNAFDATEALTTGACADARFGIIQDLKFLSDGSLLVADTGANAILKITNPLNPATCNVEHFAGTADDQAAGSFGGGDPPPAENLSTDIDNPTNGPVATATFTGPEQILVDANDVVYVRDGNRNLGGSDIMRKIDNGVVSTIATSLTNDGVMGGIALSDDGKIAMWSVDFQTLSLALIDPAAAAPATLACHSTVDETAGGGCPAHSTPGLNGCDCNSGFGSDGAGSCVAGPCTDVLKGDPSVLNGGDSSEGADVGGLAALSNGFLVWLNGGIWFIDPAHPHNNVQVAGLYEPSLDFSSDYGDPNAQHPALEVETPFSTGRAEELGVIANMSVDSNNNIYVSTELQGSSITKINCTNN